MTMALSPNIRREVQINILINNIVRYVMKVLSLKVEDELRMRYICGYYNIIRIVTELLSHQVSFLSVSLSS